MGWLFIFIIIFHVLDITFHLSINSLTYSTCNTFFYHYYISILVKISNFTLVFFKATYHVNPGAVRKRAGSSSYTSRHLFRKFFNTSANNNMSLWTYKKWCSPKFQNLYKLFCVNIIYISKTVKAYVTVKIFFFM